MGKGMESWINMLVRSIKIQVILNGLFLTNFRLAYPVYMIEQILKDVSDKEIKVHILYDIACTLEAHLKVFAMRAE